MIDVMRNTIKKHEDFAISEIYPIAKSHYFLVKVRPTLFPGDARYGLITTKRTFKHAVDRNRARRLLRVWIRHNDKLLNPDMDYVFIARAGILDASLDQGTTAMAKALIHLNKVS